MKFRPLVLTVFLVICLLFSFFSTVKAVPPLPSSFHGVLQVNGENVPAGTEVTAWINGVQYSSVLSLMYEGDSVYAIDVPGDDLSTTEVIEGGVAGDTIIFKIDGVEATQTGTWATGSNVNLDLDLTGQSHLLFLPLIMN